MPNSCCSATKQASARKYLCAANLTGPLKAPHAWQPSASGTSPGARNSEKLIPSPRRVTSPGSRHPHSVFVIAADGTILGTHRKINTLRGGTEAWSSPGDRVTPIPAEPFRRVGILICADAYSPGIAQSLQAQGAQLLVSSAAWAPGLHGPDGEWERCTRDTGLPLFVCNRTGPDRTLDFPEAESAIVKDGERLLAFRSKRSAIFTIAGVTQER